MSEFYVTANIIKRTHLHKAFIKDIAHCEELRIPIIVGKPVYGTEGDISISRADGKPFQSGSIRWTHDNSKWEILVTPIKVELPEDLFTL